MVRVLLPVNWELVVISVILRISEGPIRKSDLVQRIAALRV